MNGKMLIKNKKKSKIGIENSENYKIFKVKNKDNFF